MALTVRGVREVMFLGTGRGHYVTLTLCPNAVCISPQCSLGLYVALMLVFRYCCSAQGSIWNNKWCRQIEFLGQVGTLRVHMYITLAFCSQMVLLSIGWESVNVVSPGGISQHRL
jgi:hypothetical protein